MESSSSAIKSKGAGQNDRGIDHSGDKKVFPIKEVISRRDNMGSTSSALSCRSRLRRNNDSKEQSEEAELEDLRKEEPTEGSEQNEEDEEDEEDIYETLPYDEG